MSTFSGKIQEIQNISVDRFDGENVKSEAYFLSHCHFDHMVGLSEYSFLNQLVDNKKYLYASQISCTILKQMYPYISNNLIALSLNVPKSIQLENASFSVTLIPAGHCPGSVMFLFENCKTVLYTGDYRINANDIKKFKSFYDSHGRVKVIDKLYLDTTFFSKKYPSFPKREESHTQLCRILKQWIDENTCTYINLHTSARYGYEYAFKEIFKTTGMPIHVSANAFKFYSFVPELDTTVTIDGTKTRIHSHCGLKFGNICIDDDEAKINKIRMSAMRWAKGTECEPESGIHYICYSTHASYEEGATLINLLKPKDIEICVEYKNDPYINDEIIDLVQYHLNELKIDSKENVVVPKLFNTDKRKALENRISDEFDNDYWDIDSTSIEVSRNESAKSVQPFNVDEGLNVNEEVSFVEIVEIDSPENVVVPKLFNKEKGSESLDNKDKNSVSASSSQFERNVSTKSDRPLQMVTVDAGIDGKEKISQENVVDSSSNDTTVVRDVNGAKLSNENSSSSEGDCVLNKFLFTPPESKVCKNVDEVEKTTPVLFEEEDSVIYNILNWSPPNKRKK